MKASSATSATEAASSSARPNTGRSSGAPRPSLTTAETDFALAGPSDPPDPATHAYRKDLADIALAGRVIASHYAEPLARSLATATTLRAGPSADAQQLRELAANEPFELLDDTLGWAWGYAGADRRVGYVPVSALGA